MLGDFGYTPIYDSSKDSYAETAKIDFNYDKKQYRFQLWKGQYLSGEIGTVGGSVSFCTNPADATVGDVYFAPDKSDWLKMEMTVLWDEFDNGEYGKGLSKGKTDEFLRPTINLTRKAKVSARSEQQITSSLLLKSTWLFFFVLIKSVGNLSQHLTV